MHDAMARCGSAVAITRAAFLPQKVIVDEANGMAQLVCGRHAVLH